MRGPSLLRINIVHRNEHLIGQLWPMVHEEWTGELQATTSNMRNFSRRRVKWPSTIWQSLRFAIMSVTNCNPCVLLFLFISCMCGVLNSLLYINLSPPALLLWSSKLTLDAAVHWRLLPSAKPESEFISCNLKSRTFYILSDWSPHSFLKKSLNLSVFSHQIVFVFVFFRTPCWIAWNYLRK